MYQNNNIAIAFFIVGFSGCFAWHIAKDNDMKSFEFTQGRFSLYDDVQNFLPLSVSAIEQREKEITAEVLRELKSFVTQDRAVMTKESVLYRYDALTRAVEALAETLQIVEMVHPDEQVRHVAQQACIRMNEFSIEHFDDKPVYQVFRDFHNKKELMESLDAEEKYAFDEHMEEFKRSGLMLDGEDFAEFKVLQKRQTKLESTFESNINADNSFITVTKDELDGLQDSFIEALEKSDNGQYRLYADGPTKSDVLSYCTVEETRKRLWELSVNQAYPQNVSILEELLAVRQQSAKMLGYHDYAELSLSKKMAKNPARVRSFLKTVANAARKKCTTELAAWKKIGREDVMFEGDKILPWNIAFLKKKYEREFFDLDERALRPYFSMNDTINGIFKIYQDFLGLRFEVSPAQGAWHEDVQLITVYEKDNQEPYGYIYLDLFPRKSKYSHACHANIVKSTFLPDGSKSKSAGAVIANFPKPTVTEPSLLTHYDAVTFFHEFGHAMHFVLGTTKLACFSGTSTLWDFVELPSQMFEEWMWQSEMIKKISKHYQTGETLSDELITKMIAKKKYDVGYGFCRQLVFADFSLTLHEMQNPNFDELLKKLSQRYTPEIAWREINHFYTSFGHLTNYDAGYYGYLWSLVFSCDIFNCLLQDNLSSEAGDRFVKMVLGKGGSVHPDMLLEGFLGRKPSMEPFFKAYDLQ